MSNKRPPRKTIGPLCRSSDGQSVMQWVSTSYTNAMPFPLAPLQAIKQHEMGVVVMTNPPSALDNGLLDKSFKMQDVAAKDPQGRRISHALGQCRLTARHGSQVQFLELLR